MASERRVVHAASGALTIVASRMTQSSQEVGEAWLPNKKAMGRYRAIYEQRLEAEGVIRGYQAVVDPVALGQGFEVFLDLDLTDFARGSIEAFESAMTGFDEVIELHRLFGTPDYIVRIATVDTAAYEAFLTDRVLTIPGISRVSSRFAMRTLKSLRPTEPPSAL